jgi:hypothetical protein
MDSMIVLGADPARWRRCSLGHTWECAAARALPSQRHDTASSAASRHRVIGGGLRSRAFAQSRADARSCGGARRDGFRAGEHAEASEFEVIGMRRICAGRAVPLWAPASDRPHQISRSGDPHPRKRPGEAQRDHRGIEPEVAASDRHDANPGSALTGDVIEHENSVAAAHPLSLQAARHRRQSGRRRDDQRSFQRCRGRTQTGLRGWRGGRDSAGWAVRLRMRRERQRDQQRCARANLAKPQSRTDPWLPCCARSAAHR